MPGNCTLRVYIINRLVTDVRHKKTIAAQYAYVITIRHARLGFGSAGSEP